jgi:hypothetical protein
MSYIDMPFLNNAVSASSRVSSIYRKRFYQMYSALCGSYVHFINSSRFCYFWYRSRNSTTNSEFGISYKTRALSFYGRYDDYFYGVLDANIGYFVNVSISLTPMFNSVIINMLASFICVPFSNKI